MFNVQFSTPSVCIVVHNLIDSYVCFTLDLDLTIFNTGSINMQDKPTIKCSNGTISPNQTVVACMNANLITFFHWLCLIQQDIQLECLQTCGVPAYDAVSVLTLPVQMFIQCPPFLHWLCLMQQDIHLQCLQTCRRCLDGIPGVPVYDTVPVPTLSAAQLCLNAVYGALMDVFHRCAFLDTRNNSIKNVENIVYLSTSL